MGFMAGKSGGKAQYKGPFFLDHLPSGTVVNGDNCSLKALVHKGAALPRLCHSEHSEESKVQSG
jgi:hypothetical protein